MGSAHYDALLLVLILIGVPLECEDAVRLLELVVGGRALHTQYAVVASQRHPSMDREERAKSRLEGGALAGGRLAQTYNTRVQSKVRSLANLAAASATCQPAAAARRSQARRGAQGGGTCSGRSLGLTRSYRV